jgi:predicted DNA binding protein
MSVIAKVVVPATDLPSAGIPVTNGGNTARLERVVSDGVQPMPYVWIEGEQRASLVDDVDSRTDGTEVVVVDELADRTLYRLELPADGDSIFHQLDDTDVLTAKAADGTWRFQLAFAGHERFVEFYRWCIEKDVAIEVDRVYDPADSRQSSFEFALTPTQRETLLTAFRRGYFDVPRDVNLMGLAEEFDISDTASSRIVVRRGTSEHPASRATFRVSRCGSESAPASCRPSASKRPLFRTVISMSRSSHAP